MSKHSSQPTDQGDVPTPSERLVASLHGEEEPEYLLETPGGTVERERGHRTDELTPAADAATVVAVTDRRVVVLVPGSAGRPSDDQRFPIHFADVDRVGLDDPSHPSLLAIGHEQGHRWRIPVAESDAEAGAAVADYIRTGAEVWTAVQETASTVHASREDLVAPIRDGGDWDLVSDRYDYLAERVADARRTADGTPFTDVTALLSTVDRAERTLESAYTKALLVGVTDATATARWHPAAADRDAAVEAFATAAERYREAVTRVTEYDVDPVEPTPPSHQRAITVGEKTIGRPPLSAPDTETALEFAADRVATVGHRVVERAADHRDAAAETDDPDETVASLEAAFETYRSLLDHRLAVREALDVECEQLQSRVEEVVASLVDVRRQAADTAEWAAHGAVAEDDEARAHALFTDAIDHLEAAHDLAREFRAGDPEPIRTTLDRLRADRSDLTPGAAIRR